MSVISRDGIAELDVRYGELLPDPAALDRLIEPARSRFRTDGFVQVPDVLPAEALTDVAAVLLPVLQRVAEPVRLLQTPTAERTLSDGASFRRLDPRQAGARSSEPLVRLMDTLGVTAFGAELAARLTPLVRNVVGPVSYERVYLYLYGEGDYISVHDDHHVGDRVDVQFPVTFGTVAGIRVLRDGLLAMHYDCAGTMNVLGPRTWHEVPPILRAHPPIDPFRVNLGLRFVPALGR